MKIDFNYKFKNLDGTDIPERPPEMASIDGEMKKKTYPVFTLRTCCVNVLTMNPTSERGKPAVELTGKEKVGRYDFAKKIYDSKGLLDLEAEEITLLKDLIGKVYPPITVGQAYKILDPHSDKK
ncbi:MAG TPA: hypothetical protein ENI23_00790 [bacterium]|nr:hypothetical protein [bacterium]